MWQAGKRIQDNYFEVVSNALRNEKTFNNFKQDKNYYAVVGLGNGKYAEKSYEVIKKERPSLDLSKYCANDSVGNPNLWTTPDGLDISPSTLRYLCSAINIDHNLTLPDDSLSVVDLGAGYGGLCFVMNTYFDIVTYELLDTPEVVELASRCLSKLNVDNLSVGLDRADLFVSEFCLSEFSNETIHKFYEKDVLRCDQIYILSNLHQIGRKTWFIDLLSSDYDIEVKQEYPRTGWPNYAIYGTKKH